MSRVVVIDDGAIEGVNAEAVKNGGGTTVRSFSDPWHAFRHAHATALAHRNVSTSQIQAAEGVC